MAYQRKRPTRELLILQRRRAEDVAQQELEMLAALQLAAWKAGESAASYAKSLAERIERGAGVEEGGLRWDEYSMMARTRTGLK